MHLASAILTVLMAASCSACSTPRQVSENKNSFGSLVGFALDISRQSMGEVEDQAWPWMFSESPDYAQRKKEFAAIELEVGRHRLFSESACIATEYEAVAKREGCAFAVVAEAARQRASTVSREVTARVLESWWTDRQFPEEVACFNSSRPRTEEVEVAFGGLLQTAWFNESCESSKVFVRSVGWRALEPGSCWAPAPPPTTSRMAKRALAMCSR